MDIIHGVRDKYEICLDDILPDRDENAPQVKKMHHRSSQSSGIFIIPLTCQSTSVCAQMRKERKHTSVQTAIMDKTLKTLVG